MGSETELKFRVFEKDPGEIIDAILKDSEIISKETHKLTNEYYDTEDLQLMRSHLRALRGRARHEKGVQHTP